MSSILLNIIAGIAVLLTINVLYTSLKNSFVKKCLIPVFILVIWNACTMSIMCGIVFSLSLFFVAFRANKYKKVACVYKTITLITCIIAGGVVFRNHFLASNQPQNTIEKIDTMDQYNSKCYKISNGVRMGDGYKGDYCALQACTVYDGDLYQFFNKGYYEIREGNTMELKKEGYLNLPVSIHFGSVAFADRIENGCSIPYLYATDDASLDGNVYVIDFEKQKIVQNYSIVGGHIAAFDFKCNKGFLIGGSNKLIEMKEFDISSGCEIDNYNIAPPENLKTVQTVAFRKDKLYLLSGEINKSLIITEINVKGKYIDKISSFPFKGEPEGVFFRENGDIVVTANFGSWGANKNSDSYIHSEYFVLQKRQ